MPVDTVPEVRVLDARSRDVDERGLRELARAQTRAAGGAYVTRSYRYPYAIVASHDRPVGVDIERIEACGAAFADVICTPSERPGALVAANRDAYLSSLWSSKEALSKALGDALRYAPDRLDSPMLWPEGAAGPWRARPLAVPPGHVAWLVWRSRDGTGARTRQQGRKS